MSEKGITTAEVILGVLLAAAGIALVVLFVKVGALSAKVDDINRNGQELTAWADTSLHHWAVDSHGTLHLHVPGTMHQPPPPPASVVEHAAPG